MLCRNWRPYVATLQSDEGRMSAGGQESVLCVPFDSRVPKIRLRTRHAEAYADCRLKVVLDSWEAASVYPEGHLAQVVGLIGDADAEAQVVLIENELEAQPFGEALQRCLPDSWAIPQVFYCFLIYF